MNQPTEATATTVKWAAIAAVAGAVVWIVYEIGKRADDPKSMWAKTSRLIGDVVSVPADAIEGWQELATEWGKAMNGQPTRWDNLNAAKEQNIKGAERLASNAASQIGGTDNRGVPYGPAQNAWLQAVAMKNYALAKSLEPAALAEAKASANIPVEASK